MAETTLTPGEARLLASFATKRNEDGRVQTNSVNEAKAAMRLKDKDLVRVVSRTLESTSYRGFLFGRNGGKRTHSEGWLDVRLTDRGQLLTERNERAKAQA